MPSTRTSTDRLNVVAPAAPRPNQSNMKLGIVVGSTRPGRAGKPIADWFADFAAHHGRFQVELLDLAQFDLPLLNEAAHPRLRKYDHAHTKAWSTAVDSADAFAFVTPEYNYGSPPALVNALDYLSAEWAYKPACFVSYGGISGGLRSVQMSKLIVTSLKMMPLPEGVIIPMFAQYLDKEKGTFAPPSTQSDQAKIMLDELVKWAEALAPMRLPK
ncbi:MAG: NAD(P)H-dependent oxidoreductase [Spirochaetia bacterium]|nr:NAD(P)H-dependent oxidoreductase [Spirochaetia bacterium]